MRIGSPPGGRQIGQWIIGTSLGLYFTPYVIREVAGWWWLLARGRAFAIGLGYGGGVLLARLAGIDRTTGIFASVPGGAAEMSVLGERFGARVDRVAAAQSLRILIVVLVIPFAYAASDLHGADAYVPGASQFDGDRLRDADGGDPRRQRDRATPAPSERVCAGLARGCHPVDRNAGRPVGDTARSRRMPGNVCLAARSAPASSRDFLAGAHRFITAVAASVLAAIALSAGVAMALAAMTGLHPATVVLGMAPGGIAEMCITAKVLQLGVPLVTAFHVTRVVVLLLVTAPLVQARKGISPQQEPNMSGSPGSI